MTTNQLIAEFEKILGPARRDDRMVLTRRGACLVAAQAYEDAFGPQDKDVVTTADEMAARLSA